MNEELKTLVIKEKIKEIKNFYIDTAWEYMRECNSIKEHVLHNIENNLLKENQRSLKNVLDEMEDVMKMVLNIEKNNAEGEENGDNN